MTIFGVLFKFWPQFCEFRKNLTDEKIMSVLERRQEYNKQKKKLSVIDDEKLVKVRQFILDLITLSKGTLYVGIVEEFGLGTTRKVTK